MSDHLQAIVQIRAADGKFAGSGFFHTDGFIVTCAHVVASCFPGSKDTDAAAPEGHVKVRFYRCSGRPEFNAQVAKGGWFPEEETIDGLSDVAILEPSEVPQDLEGLALSRLPKEGSEYDCVVNAYIESVGDDPGIRGNAGLFQTSRGKRAMNAKHDFLRFIVPGCSGAPVFHQQGDSVEGIIEVRDINVQEARFTPAGALRRAISIVKATRNKQELTAVVIDSSIEFVVSNTDEFLVVHEYNLLETRLVGRNRELVHLSNWTDSEKPILVIEAFGGYGKSALAWHWWQGERSSDKWDGGFWFSFYAPSATQREFFVRLHAHLTGGSVDQSRTLAVKELAAEVLSLCRTRRYLIVLDGFERTLLFADRVDANVEDTADEQKVKPGNPTVFTGSRLRSGAKPDASLQLRDPKMILADELRTFLVSIADSSNSRVLITTRYMPTNLETHGGAPRRGVELWKLKGLDLEGVRSFWHEQGLDADAQGLERLRDGVAGHPLSLAIMAGWLSASMVSLEEFFAQNRSFPVLGHIGEDGRDDVFREALLTLSSNARHLITILALFSVPVPIKGLHALLCESEDLLAQTGDDHKLFLAFDDFADALLELRERNFVSGPIAAAVDLHPLIRSVVIARASMEDASWADKEIVKRASQLPHPWLPKSVDELATSIQLMVSATRTGNWRIAMETWAFRLQENLERLHQKRLAVRLMSLFFENTDQDTVEWRQNIPYVNMIGIPKEEIEQFLMLRGLSSDDVFSLKARQDFSMHLAGFLRDLGNYDLALRLYHIHNRTCPEPFCRIMQISALEEAGRFGEAAAVIGECLIALDVEAISPKEKARLAEGLFYDCIARGQFTDARWALARWISVLRKWQWQAFGDENEGEVLRSLNCAIAVLAREEGKTEAAVTIASEVVKHAERERNIHDTVTSLRTEAECLRANGRLNDAVDAYDRILALDPDGSTHGGAALDAARQARNRVMLGDLEGGRLELEQALSAAETMLSTRAKILIFVAELQEVKGDRAAQIKALREALDIYSAYPGTPADIWGVRTILNALRKLQAIDDAEIHSRRLAPPHTWERSVLTGTDAARVLKDGDQFSLAAIWSLDAVG